MPGQCLGTVSEQAGAWCSESGWLGGSWGGVLVGNGAERPGDKEGK